MESSGNNRGGLLSAGGVLSIIVGILQVIGGLLFVVNIVFPDWSMYLQYLGPGILFMPFVRDVFWLVLMQGIFEGLAAVLFAVCVGVLGVVAIVGGISAIRRNIFGLSLAGAICALPSGILGIMAVVFVGLGKREFNGARV